MPDGIFGDWTVRRTMIDFLAGATYGFAGDAVVTADAFIERGTMRIGAHAMPASRAYRLEPRDHSMRVLHADGRDFIELELKAMQTVRHHCGADVYVGRFFFRSCDEWVEAWRVKGPRKNYASLGRFRRRSGPLSISPAARAVKTGSGAPAESADLSVRPPNIRR